MPGRMALLVTLFLVLVNIFNNVTTNTPKAEGLTAIEAWMLACILFVFAALAEYAAILFHKMNLVIGNQRQNKQTYEVGYLNIKYISIFIYLKQSHRSHTINKDTIKCISVNM